ncbi:putative membrane protein YesL [Natronobacillus azotifigens]|uniref:DUF624 domain-containing protein n=1 Tax=Natronobacillus azotifigens TaxID=472978 RepID=A0A9J6RDD4_9BACI|nr:DUF624 domain-containing protein [Natronobacillus azotifigens]MCZ0703559.1 DUF624 domain-containing protein [Natronobacillus azotifigens]
MHQNSWFTRIGTLGFHLLLLNVFFWLGVLLGIGVLGFFPSLVALFASSKQLILEKDDQYLYRNFWQNYIKEFLTANILGLMYTLSISGLYLYYRILQMMTPSLWTQLGVGILIFVLFVVALSLSTVFPLFVHYKYPIVQYPKFALVYALSRPIHTIALALILFIFFIVYIRFVPLFLLIGVSSIALVTMWIGSSHLARKSEL